MPSATARIARSVGVVVGFTAEPSIRRAWSKCGSSSAFQSVMPDQCGSS